MDRYVIVRTGGKTRFVAVRTFEDVRSMEVEELLEYGVAIGFEVERTWKGVAREIVTVITGAGGGDCGYPFKPDERYLVYADTHPRGGSLGTSICQRTRLLGEAGADLAALGEGDVPAPVPPSTTDDRATRAIPAPFVSVVAVLAVVVLGRILYWLLRRAKGPFRKSKM